MLLRTINCLIKCKLINKIILSTDENCKINIENYFGLQSIIRPDKLSLPDSSLEDVLQHALSVIESSGDFCDSVSVAEIIYPFRESETIDKMIKMMIDESLDTLFASWEEARATWFGEDGDLTMLGGTSWAIPSKQGHGQIVTSLIGYFTITKPSRVRNKDIFSGNIKTHSLTNRNSTVVCRNQSQYNELSRLIENDI